ncbi:hypothetical protein L596_003784 [Steinernema carpocapsae]|uniref:Transmembrane protein 199 n=1 Tax=Steinernema carpocapsae TaxID=34508 RepID=A0A4U8UTN6_STECR|nr:hypothetical protein L596_003784 [Steinernema carpocapsae]
MWTLREQDYAFVEQLCDCFDASTLKLSSGKLLIEALKDQPITQRILEECRTIIPAEMPFFMAVEKLCPYKAPEAATDNTEYKKRIEALKLLQEERDYMQMTKTIDPSQKYGRDNLMENFGQEMRSANRHLIAVFNTLLTVAGAFAFGFFGIEIAYPHLGLDMVKRMIIGLVLAVVVFFADLYFIIKGLGEDIESDKDAFSSTVLNLKKTAGSKTSCSVLTPSEKLPLEVKKEGKAESKKKR